jgi:hypothetical protein
MKINIFSISVYLLFFSLLAAAFESDQDPYLSTTDFVRIKKAEGLKSEEIVLLLEQRTKLIQINELISSAVSDDQFYRLLLIAKSIDLEMFKNEARKRLVTIILRRESVSFLKLVRFLRGHDIEFPQITEDQLIGLMSTKDYINLQLSDKGGMIRVMLLELEKVDFKKNPDSRVDFIKSHMHLSPRYDELF